MNNYFIILLVLLVSSCCHVSQGQGNHSPNINNLQESEVSNIADSIKMIVSVMGRSFVILQDIDPDDFNLESRFGPAQLVHGEGEDIWAATQEISSRDDAPFAASLEGSKIHVLLFDNEGASLEEVELGKAIVITAFIPHDSYLLEWEGRDGLPDEPQRQPPDAHTIANQILILGTKWLAVEIKDGSDGGDQIAFLQEDPILWTREEVSTEIQQSAISQLKQSTIATNIQQQFLISEAGQTSQVHWVDSNVAERSVVGFEHQQVIPVKL